MRRPVTTPVKSRSRILCGALCVLALGSTPRVAADPEPSRLEAPPAEAVDETALTIRLYPVPETLPAPARDKLTASLSLLLGQRKILNAELERYFATYGSQISPESPQYPAYQAKRTEIMAANDQLLAKMRAYNQETLAALGRYIAQLDAQIKQTRANLVALQKSFAAESEAFNDLADMGQAERDALLNALRDRVVESGFVAGEAGVEKALERAASITPRNAEKLIAQLKRAGADNPDLLDLVKAIGAAKDKKARLAAGKRLYKLVKDEKTIWKLNELAGREEYLAALIELISWVSPSPWLQVCAEGLFDVGKANLTVWFVLGPAETALSATTEEQMRQLKQIGERFVALVDTRKKAKEELRVLPTKAVEVPSGNDLAAPSPSRD
jgi:hypothetical protein